MLQDLGKVLLTRIQELREDSGGKIDIHNIDEIIKSMMDAIKGHISSQNDIHLYNEIEKIALQIRSVKQEVQLSRPEQISASNIPGATLELSAVTQATEQATNTILDSAEAIQNIAMTLQDTESRDKILEHITTIFEASNFQDLTGQRINKVINTLEDIEKRVGALIKAFLRNQNNGSNSGDSDPNSERHLLNGPQLDGQAPSQDDIDDLFNRL